MVQCNHEENSFIGRNVTLKLLISNNEITTYSYFLQNSYPLLYSYSSTSSDIAYYTYFTRYINRAISMLSVAILRSQDSVSRNLWSSSFVGYLNSITKVYSLIHKVLKTHVYIQKQQSSKRQKGGYQISKNKVERPYYEVC